MEKIYKPELFKSTQHINLEEYFIKYRSVLFKEQKTKCHIDDKIISVLKDINYTKENMLELNLTTSIDHLNLGAEQTPVRLEDLKGIKSASTLCQAGEIDDESRILHTIKHLENRKKDLDEERRLLRELRDRTLHIKDNRPEGVGIPNLNPGEEVVVCIRLFRTFAYRYSQPCSDDAFKFDQEITILGSQTLADLRDKIKCPSDLTVLSEISENPHDKTNLISAKLLYPSGFLFIDDIFYNDFRVEESIDYSEVIRKWAKEKKIGELKTAEMDKTKIISLKPRFGYPYVYQHQGRCEHIFIFSHAKLLNSYDPLHRNCYPYHSDVGGGRVAFCYICGMSLPVWVVVDCDRLPQLQTPLCNDCFSSYCYVNGKKIGNFKAYPFVSRSAMF